MIDVDDVEETQAVRAREARLEGEVASHTRKLEQLERRGRALRAEIGRKVEELAHEESRVLREVTAEQDEGERLRQELAALERDRTQARAIAEQAERQGAAPRAVFERAGAAAAHVDAKREQIAKHDARRGARENTARDLRRQIEQLRAQLARYAEALEDDLSKGREKVAVRTRDAVALEKTFSDVTSQLLQHLKGKPECRDLFSDLMHSLGLPGGAGVSSPQAGGPVRSLEISRHP